MEANPLVILSFSSTNYKNKNYSRCLKGKVGYYILSKVK